MNAVDSGGMAESKVVQAFRLRPCGRFTAKARRPRWTPQPFSIVAFRARGVQGGGGAPPHPKAANSSHAAGDGMPGGPGVLRVLRASVVKQPHHLSQTTAK